MPQGWKTACHDCLSKIGDAVRVKELLFTSNPNGQWVREYDALEKTLRLLQRGRT